MRNIFFYYTTHSKVDTVLHQLFPKNYTMVIDVIVPANHISYTLIENLLI